MSEATAAQQYFDPPDPPAYCIDCGGRLDDNDEHLDEDDHQRWLEEQEDEDDGEEFLRKMEQAADEQAAGLPFGGSD